MPLLQTSGAALRSVRLHGAGGDPLRARQRLERALADVDWEAPGLPPQALLFVRRLVADGRAGLRSHSDGGSFGRQVTVALRERARAARRPWLHADAAEAEAVCFADEAELIACLLRDWARGAVAARWWWHGVLGHLDALRWLRVEAFHRAERLVPALALLAESGEVVGCVARLDEADAVSAWRAVQRGFGLSEVGPAPDAPDSNGPHVAPIDAAASLLSAATRAVERSTMRRLRALVPEIDAPTLNAPQRRLLAAALALTRAPSWARSEPFAEAIAQDLVISMRSLASASPPPNVAPRREPAKVVEAAQVAAALRDEGAVAEGDAHRSSPQLPATNGSPTPVAGIATGMDMITVTPHVPASTRQEPDAAPRVGADVPATAMPAVIDAPPPPIAGSRTRLEEPVVPPAALQKLKTRHGGLFYVLNAALALRVYGDFTLPRHPNLALSPWDLLAWTGRAWFGDEFMRDPLWALLATLSGRAADEAPGRFKAPAWRIDETWLQPWGGVDRLQLHATRHRLLVFHPAGFCVADVPRDGRRPLQQARALCADVPQLRHAVLSRGRPWPIPTTRSESARWLHHWLAYLNARLALTLDTAVADVPALLCAHAADIDVGHGSVDLGFALADLPLAIRFAGLDRDPGWIPAAGRTVSFHFA